MDYGRVRIVDRFVEERAAWERAAILDWLINQGVERREDKLLLAHIFTSQYCEDYEIGTDDVELFCLDVGSKREERVWRTLHRDRFGELVFHDEMNPRSADRDRRLIVSIRPEVVQCRGRARLEALQQQRLDELDGEWLDETWPGNAVAIGASC